MSDRQEVVILMGGSSSERDVSLVSGNAVMEAIDTERFHARAVDAGQIGACSRQTAATAAEHGGFVCLADEGALRDGAARLSDALFAEGRPDIVFIALHGRYGEDGAIQGMLEVLGLPYTGSGVLASALAMDKIATKRVLATCGVETPRWCKATRSDLREGCVPDVAHLCGFPAIVKPDREGSTIGCTIVHSEAELQPALEEALRHDGVALVEEFVRGTEITVGVLGTNDLEMLPAVEICPRTGFYDYRAKYTAGMTDKYVPARIDSGAEIRAREFAEATHRVVGCSGMSRVDMIVTGSVVTVLEVNTIPGFTPTSLLPRAAQAAGISFTDLITRVIDYGLEEGPR